jgi:hypothetical protein
LFAFSAASTNETGFVASAQGKPIRFKIGQLPKREYYVTENWTGQTFFEL